MNSYKKAEANKIGAAYVGKMAQSTLLTMISECGQNSIPEPAQKITAFEVVPYFGQYALMLSVGGTLVYESTCFNIQ